MEAAFFYVALCVYRRGRYNNARIDESRQL